MKQTWGLHLQRLVHCVTDGVHFIGEWIDPDFEGLIVSDNEEIVRIGKYINPGGPKLVAGHYNEKHISIGDKIDPDKDYWPSEDGVVTRVGDYMDPDDSSYWP